MEPFIVSFGISYALCAIRYVKRKRERSGKIMWVLSSDDPKFISHNR